LRRGVDEVRLDYCIAGLDKIRVGGREIHSIGHQLQHQLITGGESVFVDEIGASFPECDAPDLALVVAQAGQARAKDRASRNATVRLAWEGSMSLKVSGFLDRSVVQG